MQKIVDKRNQSEDGEYGISFAARDSLGSYDHAFVVWYYSDPAAQRTNRRGAGFYPTGGDYYDLLIGGAPGKVLDDSREDIAKQVIVLINSDLFQTALAVESQYANATYRLGTSDCVSFVGEVADKIPGLVVPSRLMNIYPSSFISDLYDSN
jgi:hypothetical protein